jgi:predicted amidohydrolase
VRVAVAQTEPKLAEPERNLDVAFARLEEAAAAGCSLIVLTEFALSGYMFASEWEAAPFAEEVPCPATEALAAACAALGLYCVVGSNVTPTGYATRPC